MFDAHDILVNERQDLVQSLEKNFDKLKKENTNLSVSLTEALNKVEKYQKFSQSMLPLIVKERLAGVHVVIIKQHNNYPYTQMTEVLETSGAKVREVTLFDKNIANSISEINAQFLDSERIITNKEFYNLIFPQLIDDVVNSRLSTWTNQINKRNLFRIKGSTLDKIDYIIVSNSAMKDSNKIDNNTTYGLSQYLVENNYSVISIENMKNTAQFINNHWNKELSFVENIDTPIGKANLVFMMESNLIRKEIANE